MGLTKCGVRGSLCVLVLVVFAGAGEEVATAHDGLEPGAYRGFGSPRVHAVDRRNLGCGGYGYRRAGYGGVGCGSVGYGGVGYGGGCDPLVGRTRYVGGSPWADLRRFLPVDANTVRAIYVRNYFLRRWPYIYAEGEPKPEDPDETLETVLDGEATTPTERQQLNLGMRRFFIADYETAEQHFDKVLVAQPKHPQARYGKFMCAAYRSRWREAAEGLRTLAEMGELRASDRLVVEGVFGEAKKHDAVMRGLADYTRFQSHDSDAHLVAAWAHGVRGNARQARYHLTQAHHWDAGNPTLAALERVFAPKEAPVVEETPPERAPKPRDVVSQPRRDSEPSRVVAKAGS